MFDELFQPPYLQCNFSFAPDTIAEAIELSHGAEAHLRSPGFAETFERAGHNFPWVGGTVEGL